MKSVLSVLSALAFLPILGDAILPPSSDATRLEGPLAEKCNRLFENRVPGGQLQRIDLTAENGVEVNVRREDVVTRYEAKIPFGSFGLSEKALADGIRFNVFVKEDDGQGPDGWMEFLPGMTERNDPFFLPLVKFE